MTGRLNEIDKRPKAAEGIGLQVTSGSLLANICTKLVIAFSVTGSLTFRMADGNSVTLSVMPVGCFTFDVQFDTVTWTGTATAVAFYNPT
jgi:hypothetical protein